MTINFTLTEEQLKTMLDKFDRNRKTWSDISELSDADVREMLNDIFEAWEWGF